MSLPTTKLQHKPATAAPTKGQGLDPALSSGQGLADKGPGLAVSMSEKEDTVLVATTSDRGKNRDDSGSGSANIGFVVVVVVMGS